MKLLEQMGGPSEQPQQESAQDQEEALEKPASPESYDETAWHKLKQGYPAAAINKGREMGVSQEELDRFAEDVIARETQNRNYGFVYRFRKSMGIGTEEEVQAVGKQAYKFLFANEDFGSAMSIAEDVYSRDSEEWQRAHEASRAAWKEAVERSKSNEKGMEDEERELKVSISKDATFADLFNAIDDIEGKEGLGALHFEEELWDNFNVALAEEVLAFRAAQASKAATTKVLDFFTQLGYPQKDISIFLPIKFKRKRKKK